MFNTSFYYNNKMIKFMIINAIFFLLIKKKKKKRNLLFCQDLISKIYLQKEQNSWNRLPKPEPTISLSYHQSGYQKSWDLE